MNEVVQHVLQEDFADLSGEQSVKFLKSSSASTREYRVQCQGSVTNTSNPGKISFAINLNPNEALDRCVSVEYTVRAVISAGAANKPLHKVNGLVLGCYPLNRITSDINVQINGNSKSYNPSEFVAAFANTKDSIEYRRLAHFPAQPDNFNTFAGMSRGAGIRVDTATGEESLAEQSATIVETPQTDSESPFTVISSGYGPSRGSFPPAKVEPVAGTALLKASVVYTFRVTEPLLHPIFRTPDYRSMLARIKTLNVDITINSLYGMFSVSNSLLKYLDATLKQSTLSRQVSAKNGSDQVIAVDEFVCFTEQPRLVYRTYQPTVAIPNVISFGFYDIATLRESLPELVAGADGFKPFTYNTQNFRLGQVPNRLIIFAKPQGTPTDEFRADGFLAIRALTVRTSADSGSFSGASDAQLFQMSARNGLNMSYKQFSRDLGSVVIIDLERGDLAGFMAGVRTDFNFDMSLTLENTQYTVPKGVNGSFLGPPTDAPNRKWDLFILAYLDSKLIVDGNTASVVNGENMDLVKQVIQDRPLTMVPNDTSMLGGKSGWHKFTSFLGNVGKVVGPALQGALQVKQLLGRGQMEGGLYDGAGIKTGGALRVLG